MMPIEPRSGEWSFMYISSWHDTVVIWANGRGNEGGMEVPRHWCSLDHERKMVIVVVPEVEESGGISI